LLRRNREFWYALVAIVAITAIYLLAYRQAGTFPRASSLVGHGIGILGFILMLMTATLYSIRKMSSDARWGSMAGWLRFHMVAGLVGPYLVLLHTSMRFHGVAGVAMLMTIVVVISGLVGRYIYTAVPRTVATSEPAMSAVDRRIEGSEVSSMAAADSASGAAVALDMPPMASNRPAESPAVSAERRSLDQRLAGLVARRGALATWRAVHVPLVLALFVIVLVHMAGALYYALG
jgi:hypothetical protein